MDYEAFEKGLSVPVVSGAELTVVIPTFNERENLNPLLDRLAVALEGRTLHGTAIVLSAAGYGASCRRTSLRSVFMSSVKTSLVGSIWPSCSAYRSAPTKSPSTTPACRRVVFETGRMAPTLYHGLAAVGLPVVCVESRQVIRQIGGVEQGRISGSELVGCCGLVLELLGRLDDDVGRFG